MTAKRSKTRGGISLFSGKKKNYESDIKDNTDLDKADDKYPLQLWEKMGETSYG